MSDQLQQPPAVTADIPNYLVFSILVTLFCCLPFGIVAIIFAAQVNSALAAGNFDAAREASKKARTWCWVAFWIGMASVIITVMLSVLGVLGMGFIPFMFE